MESATTDSCNQNQNIGSNQAVATEKEITSDSCKQRQSTESNQSIVKINSIYKPKRQKEYKQKNFKQNNKQKNSNHNYNQPNNRRNNFYERRSKSPDQLPSYRREYYDRHNINRNNCRDYTDRNNNCPKQLNFREYHAPEIVKPCACRNHEQVKSVNVQNKSSTISDIDLINKQYIIPNITSIVQTSFSNGTQFKISLTTPCSHKENCTRGLNCVFYHTSEHLDNIKSNIIKQYEEIARKLQQEY